MHIIPARRLLHLKATGLFICKDKFVLVVVWVKKLDPQAVHEIIESCYASYNIAGQTYGVKEKVSPSQTNGLRNYRHYKRT